MFASSRVLYEREGEGEKGVCLPPLTDAAVKEFRCHFSCVCDDSVILWKDKKCPLCKQCFCVKGFVDILRRRKVGSQTHNLWCSRLHEYYMTERVRGKE